MTFDNPGVFISAEGNVYAIGEDGTYRGIDGAALSLKLMALSALAIDIDRHRSVEAECYREMEQEMVWRFGK